MHSRIALRSVRTAGLLALLLLVLLASAGTAEDPAGEARELVARLDAPGWRDRVDATEALARLGPAALPALREAITESDSSPERRHRARYLLDALDPILLDLIIVRVEPGPEPRVIEASVVAGDDENRTIALRDEDGAASDSLFRVSWAPLSERSFELALEPAHSAYLGTSRRYTGSAPLVAIYDETIEGRYLRAGAIVERKRHETVTFVSIDQGRRSNLDLNTESASPSELFSRAVLSALAKAESGGGREERHSALELLAVLGLPRAEATFRRALEDPRFRLLGALGLARSGASDGLERLEEAFQAADDAAEATARRTDRLRAARFLAPRDSARAIDYLLSTFGEADTLELPPLLGDLADLAPAIARGPERDRFLELALGDNSLRKLPWRDPEVEHFLLSVLAELEPRRTSDQRIAESFCDALESIAQGKFVLDRPSLVDLSRLWNRARAVLPDPPKTASLPGELVAASLEGSRSALERRELIAAISELAPDAPLPQDIFDALVRFLDESLKAAEPGTMRLLASAIPNLSERLVFETGDRLADWVRALAPWAAAEVAGRGAGFVAGRAIADELERLTGLDPVGARALAGTNGRENPWLAWAGDPQRVAARAAELASESNPPSDEDVPEVDFWEFVLSVPPSPPALGAASEPAVEVVDGRHTVVAVGRTETYSDRWGNRRSVRLVPDERVPGKRAFRLDERTRIFVDTPSLVAARGDDRVEVEWFESSQLLPRGRFVRHDDRVTYRTLVHIVPRTAVAPDEVPRSTEDLWAEYVTNHLARPGPETDTTEWLRTARELRLPETRAGLATLLENETSSVRKVQILAELSALGDPGAKEGIRELLEGAETAASRLELARLLAQSGVREGARVALELATAHEDELRSQTRSILATLDAYFREAPRDDETRTLLFRWLAKLLDGGVQDQRLVLQYAPRFTGGDDFGYRDAIRLSGPLRDAAIETAAERARAWIASRDERSTP